LGIFEVRSGVVRFRRMIAGCVDLTRMFHECGLKKMSGSADDIHVNASNKQELPSRGELKNGQGAVDLHHRVHEYTFRALSRLHGMIR